MSALTKLLEDVIFKSHKEWLAATASRQGQSDMAHEIRELLPEYDAELREQAQWDQYHICCRLLCPRCAVGELCILITDTGEWMHDAQDGFKPCKAPLLHTAWLKEHPRKATR